ncbi:MAG: hypothetical protein U0744_03050 [Gemmataceae bacterium]
MRTFALLTSSLLLVVGCSSGDGIVPVSGSIEMDGAPLEAATVTFIPMDGVKGGGGVGGTDAAGKFVLMNPQGKSGAFPGKYKVVVSKTSLTKKLVEGVTPTVVDGDMKEQIPAKYSNREKTELVETIEAGKPIVLKLRTSLTQMHTLAKKSFLIQLHAADVQSWSFPRSHGQPQPSGDPDVGLVLPVCLRSFSRKSHRMRLLWRRCDDEVAAAEIIVFLTQDKCISNERCAGFGLVPLRRALHGFTELSCFWPVVSTFCGQASSLLSLEMSVAHRSSGVAHVDRVVGRHRNLAFLIALLVPSRKCVKHLRGRNARTI